MDITTMQKISAGEEVLTAVRLYSSGIGQLESLDDLSSDFFHLPILALQQGLERWVKISLCFHELNKTGKFPDQRYFNRSKDGHNIQPILSSLIEAVYSDELLKERKILKQDRAFFRDRHFRKYLKALSDFGTSSRYYHLNLVTGVNVPESSPEQAWQDLEGKALDFNPDLKKRFYDSGGSPVLVKELLSESRSILIRCGRALARLYAFGALGDEAKRHTSYISSFTKISDDELTSARFSPFSKGI